VHNPLKQVKHLVGQETQTPFTSSNPLKQDVQVLILEESQLAQVMMQLRQALSKRTNPILQLVHIELEVQAIQFLEHLVQVPLSKNSPGGHSRQDVADPEHETQLLLHGRQTEDER
jgi:hypothetical protein